MRVVLREHEEKRSRHPVRGEGWSGMAYVCYFTCPKGDVAYHRSSSTGELYDGAVLPERWGGVTTALPQDPRLQECEDEQPKDSAMALLRTVWISIDVE